MAKPLTLTVKFDESKLRSFYKIQNKLMLLTSMVTILKLAKKHFNYNEYQDLQKMIRRLRYRVNKSLKGGN